MTVFVTSLPSQTRGGLYCLLLSHFGTHMDSGWRCDESTYRTQFTYSMYLIHVVFSQCVIWQCVMWQYTLCGTEWQYIIIHFKCLQYRHFTCVVNARFYPYSWTENISRSLIAFSGIVCFSVFDTAFHQTCIISLFRTNIQQVIAANIVLACLAILHLSYVHNGATGELTCSNYFPIRHRSSVQNFYATNIVRDRLVSAWTAVGLDW